MRRAAVKKSKIPAFPSYTTMHQTAPFCRVTALFRPAVGLLLRRRSERRQLRLEPGISREILGS